MKTISSTTGYLVEELEDGIDTEDITVEAPALDALADRWEAMADAYAADTHCGACPWDERGFNIYSQKRWHECHCVDPDQCIAIAPKAVANAYRRQAS
jgi:hypothetical protein